MVPVFLSVNSRGKFSQVRYLLEGRSTRCLLKALPTANSGFFMSELRKETIEQLQEIIRYEYGRTLSFSETSKIAHDLVKYFDVLAKINSNKKSI